MIWRTQADLFESEEDKLHERNEIYEESQNSARKEPNLNELSKFEPLSIQ